MVLVGGNVVTMNPTQPRAEAIAIRKDRIVKVGSSEEITQLIGTDTKVIRLNGKTVVPGFIDTHIHVADFGKCLLWLDLTSAKSVKELQSLLREKAKQTPAGKWIIGRGWDQNRFKEKRLLNLSDLNEVAPDNPVILYHESAMICAVNSKALAFGDITGQTVAPPGGTIDKNQQTGELAGILRDNATSIVWRVVPEPILDELSEATALACQKIAESGITSVHWIVLLANELPIIQRLHTNGKLPIRVNVVLPDNLRKETDGLRSTCPLMLHVGAVVVAADGYLDSKTAALLQPYNDDQNNYGKMLLNAEELSTSVSQILALGLQPVIHAMGDKAIDTALKVIEQTALAKAVRFRIEQAAVLNEGLVKRLKAQKVVVSVQPKVIATEFAVWSATERLGVERARWLHPIRTLIKEGVKVAGGSDCPMEPLSPLSGVQAAVTREFFPQEQITVDDAMRMYTVDAAYASSEENIKGSVEKGKLADLVVISHDPREVPHSEIGNIKVEMTIVGGSVVYPKQ